MSSRNRHRLKLFMDRDTLHTLVVAGLACVLSAGLVYVGYYLHVWRTARGAPCRPDRGECVLVFGKHAPAGRIDRDFEGRLDRTISLWRDRPPATLLLLGGGPLGQLSEAEIARAELLARGLAPDAPLRLESQSRDTLQNLRNARTLLGPGNTRTVTLLSSRYHLARCALMARQLGFQTELCAAEPRLHFGPRMAMRLAGEAAYVCWADVGTRWARMIGHQRMLARVS